MTHVVRRDGDSIPLALRVDPIALRVRSILIEQLGLEDAEVLEEANLFDDLGADSLDLVEVQMTLEETFAIELPDEELAGLRTVADLEHYVRLSTAP